MTWQRQQGGLSEIGHPDSISDDLLDEKTPTSMYLPRFASSIQMRADPAAGNSGGYDSPERSGPLVNDFRHGEPSVIIAPELTPELWCDGVADTVAVVRRRRSNAAVLILIAILSGLFAISAGILLAECASGHCSMWSTNHLQPAICCAVS